MTADRRTPKHGLYRAISLVAALAVALSARPAAAGPVVPGAALTQASPAASPRSAPVSTRIEGEVRAIQGDVWQVDDLTVICGPKTFLSAKRGAAEPGAWVLVVGEQYDDYILAELIEVQRPATAPAPTYQYTGRLRIKSDAYWFVGDVLINVLPDVPGVNDITAGGIPTGAIVRATVRRDGHDLKATEVKVLAADPEKLPVAIEGVVEQVTDTTWVVDNNTIVVPESQAVPVEQGDTVEVAALDYEGTLVAQQARVVDNSRQASIAGYLSDVSSTDENDQTWTLIVFEADRTTRQTIHVTADTYVDEDRAVAEPGLEAQVEGEKTGPTSVAAALVRLNQLVPATAVGALTVGKNDTLSRVGNERVWFGSEQLTKQAAAAAGLKASTQGADRATGGQVAVRGVRLSNGVIIAQEVSGATGDFAAAAASTQSPASVNWVGPSYINPAIANASKPTVLFDAAGAGHAVYESQGIIYYSYRPKDGAWSAPQKIGTGVSPSAVLDAAGLPQVAYRGEFLKNYDIIHVHKLATGKWTLPVVIAPTTGASADPALAADASGKVYAAWMDRTSGAWTIQLGTWDGHYWTTCPVYYGRGQSPALIVKSDGTLFIAWQDRVPLGQNLWGNYEIYATERKSLDEFTSLPASISDNQTYRPGANSLGVRLTSTSDGLVHVAWVDDNSQVRYLYGKPGYWPVPRNVGTPRPLVRGISLEAATDGLLYLALDEGEIVSVITTEPRTQEWPAGQVIAARTSPTDAVSDVSLSSSADRVTVAWVQVNAAGSMSIYESQHITVMQPVKYWLPLILGQ